MIHAVVMTDRRLSGHRRLSLLGGAGLLALLAAGSPGDALATCTATGTATITSCTSTYVLIEGNSATVAATLDSMSTGGVELRTGGSASGYDYTLTLTGSVVINNPSYSGVISQSYDANRNYTVIVQDGASITSGPGGFGGIWVRNDTSGNATIRNAGTVVTSGSDSDGVTSVTNGGTASVVNSGTVTANNARGLYADGGHDNTPDATIARATITNSGTVTGYLAGARAVGYNGLATITNTGSITSLRRQGAVAWGVLGATLINSGTVTARNEIALQGAADTGNITITNSGRLTASDDASITSDSGYGYYGIKAETDISGNVTLTNTSTGSITAMDDGGIYGSTPSGTVVIANQGTINAKRGLEGMSGDSTVSVTNSGTITTTGLGVSLAGTTANTFTNTGTITSGGITVQSNDTATTILNQGTLSAGSATATAISLGAGDDRVRLTPSSSITGLVSAGGGNNTLELVGGGGSFDVATLGGAAQYRGFQTVEKTGDGMWILTGSGGGFTGAVHVSGGALAVNGTTSASVGVDNGATLQGTGSTGAVVVHSGGTHSPGNSIGTQTVNGSYTLESGSTLAIQVSESGQMDKVVVTAGTVTLTGANLVISTLTGSPALGQIAGVLIDNQTGQGVVGQFGTVTNNLAFYDASVRYDGGTGDDVVLTLNRNSKAYADVAATPNQAGVASILPGLSGGDGQTIQNAILGLSTAGAQDAYTQLSGNIYPTTQTLTQTINRQGSLQVSGHLANMRAGQAGPGQAGLSMSAPQLAGFTAPQGESGGAVANPSLIQQDGLAGGTGRQLNGVWTQAIGGVGRIDGDGNAVRTDYDWYGMIGGYDRQVSADLTVGGFFGYTNGRTKQNSIRSRVETDTVMTGLYGEYRLDGWRFNGQAGWSRTAADSTRHLNFGGISRTAQADYVDQSLFAEAEVAHGWGLGHDMWVEPYANLSGIQQFLGGFTETGADAANLRRDSDSKSVSYGKLGVRFSTALPLDSGATLLPQAGLAWKRLLGPKGNASDLAFGSGSDHFVVNATPSDRDTLVANVGGAVTIGQAWQVYAQYSPAISERQTEHSVLLGGRYTW